MARPRRVSAENAHRRFASMDRSSSFGGVQSQPMRTVRNARCCSRVLLTILLVSLVGWLACEDTGGLPLPTIEGPNAPGMGSSCDVLIDAGPKQGVYNSEALECTSRVCVKPVVQADAIGPADTTAFCTAECTQDSDCKGQLRDSTNPSDTRCQNGFACGVLFAKGSACCKKFCICKDFLAATGPQIPYACVGDAGATCSQ